MQPCPSTLCGARARYRVSSATAGISEPAREEPYEGEGTEDGAVPCAHGGGGASRTAAGNRRAGGGGIALGRVVDRAGWTGRGGGARRGDAGELGRGGSRSRGVGPPGNTQRERRRLDR